MRHGLKNMDGGKQSRMKVVERREKAPDGWPSGAEMRLFLNQNFKFAARIVFSAAGKSPVQRLAANPVANAGIGTSAAAEVVEADY